MHSQKKHLILVVGPTAIGKTSTSVRIAKHFNTDVISSDSRQFFKEMSIGTAKPTEEEMDGVNHHFINHLSIHEDYSAGDFERDALELTEKLFQEKDVIVVCGGSGLYVNALCYGFDELPEDKTIRDQLMKRLEELGKESLQQQLKELDPATAERIDLDNVQRVVRALEVCLTSGRPYSSFRTNNVKSRPFEMIFIGLEDERKHIYERINLRVDQMVNEGLIEEVRRLNEYRKINALKTVGYRELFRAFDGEITEDQAIENIKKNTRNYAKRQLTWFRRNESVNWFRAAENDEIIQFLEKQIAEA